MKWNGMVEGMVCIVAFLPAALMDGRAVECLFGGFGALGKTTICGGALSSYF